MPAPRVVFDETGNTGQNLLDPDQSVFALASLCMDDDTVARLLALATPPGAKEAKFSRLRQSTPGQRRILEVLRDPAISDTTTKLSVYHKRFMVTTKIADLLVEPLVHARGGDFYAEGQNIAFANMLHAVTPVFCGRDHHNRMLTCFVAMVRDPRHETIDAFYMQIDAMMRDSVDREFISTLDLLRQSRIVIDQLVNIGDVTALDPAIPSFVDLASQWTYQLGVPFDVVHDASKPLQHLEDRLRRLISLSNQSVVYENRGVGSQLPLLATGIEFVDSFSVPAIQLADLVAGATGVMFRAYARGGRDRFAEQISASRLGELAIAPVWPTMAVTPDELGTRGWSGSASLDHSIRLLGRPEA